MSIFKIFKRFKDKVKPPYLWYPKELLKIHSGKAVIFECPYMVFKKADKDELDYLLNNKGLEEKVITDFWLTKNSARIRVEDIGTTVFKAGSSLIFKDKTYYDLEMEKERDNCSSNELKLYTFDSSSRYYYVMDLKDFEILAENYFRNKNKNVDEILLGQQYIIIDIENGKYQLELVNQERKSNKDPYAKIIKQYDIEITYSE